jgi:uncharacterized protein YdeI (YjbR/CyaY-like superfamily)
MTDVPELLVPDAVEWRCWLEDHHAQDTGVWLILAKKGTTEPTTLNYDEALEEALCYGWIDGQTGRRDDGTYRQRFTPRRKRSPWSKRNVGIVARLIQDGRMQPSGRAEIDRAKADGRWEAAYAGSGSIEMPDDLESALSADPVAHAMFGILTSQNRYAILYRIRDAKRADTRARRIQRFVQMLGHQETPYPQKRKLPSAKRETPARKKSRTKRTQN